MLSPLSGRPEITALSRRASRQRRYRLRLTTSESGQATRGGDIRRFALYLLPPYCSLLHLLPHYGSGRQYSAIRAGIENTAFSNVALPQYGSTMLLRYGSRDKRSNEAELCLCVRLCCLPKLWAHLGGKLPASNQEGCRCEESSSLEAGRRLLPKPVTAGWAVILPRCCIGG